MAGLAFGAGSTVTASAAKAGTDAANAKGATSGVYISSDTVNNPWWKSTIPAPTDSNTLHSTITSFTITGNFAKDGTVYTYPLSGLKITLSTTYGVSVVKIGPDCQSITLKVAFGEFMFTDATSKCSIRSESSANSLDNKQLFGVTVGTGDKSVNYILPMDVWFYDTNQGRVVKKSGTVTWYEPLNFAKCSTDADHMLVNIDGSFNEAFKALSYVGATESTCTAPTFNKNFFLITLVVSSYMYLL
jgi:hypothetical protein